ncbi:hypothetical protein PIROE2DRAFT_6047, partial [Piromyces sp. E2]
MEYEFNEQNTKNLNINTSLYNTINTLINALEELLQSKKIQEIYGKIYNSSIIYKKLNYKKQPKNNFKFSFNNKLTSNSNILSKRKRHYEDIIYKESKSQRLSNYLSNHLREMNVQSYPNSHFQPEKNSKLNYNQKNFFVNENFNYNNSVLNDKAQYNLNLNQDKNKFKNNDLNNNKYNYDLYINRSVNSIYQWMEYQKDKLGMNEEEYKKEWEIKRKKLEYNISLFENSVLKDSYDDIRSIIQEIVVTLEYLSGGCVEELKDLIPTWKNSHYYVFSALNYIQIVEDMKEFVSTSYEMDNSFDIFIFNLKEMIKDKKEKYNDIIKTNGKYWRSMSFPVNENLINEVKNRIYSYLYIGHLKLNQLLDENNIYQCNYDPKNSVIIKWMESLFELLQLTEECFEFINDSCPNSLIEQFNDILIINDQSTTKAKNEAQFFALFENCLQLLKFINTICSKNSDIIYNMLNINVTDNGELENNLNSSVKIDSLNNQMNNNQFFIKLKNYYKYIKQISDIAVNNLEKINEIRKQNHSNKEEFIFNHTINTHDKLNETLRHNDLTHNKSINFEDPDGVILNSTSSSCSSYMDSNFDLDWRISTKNNIIDDPK